MQLREGQWCEFLYLNGSGSGSGCGGSTGRAVTSDARGLHFKSSHRQIIFIVSCIEKTKTAQEWTHFICCELY